FHLIRVPVTVEIALNQGLRVEQGRQGGVAGDARVVDAPLLGGRLEAAIPNARKDVDQAGGPVQRDQVQAAVLVEIDGRDRVEAHPRATLVADVKRQLGGEAAVPDPQQDRDIAGPPVRRHQVEDLVTVEVGGDEGDRVVADDQFVRQVLEG